MSAELPLAEVRQLLGVQHVRHTDQHLEIETTQPLATLAALHELAAHCGRSAATMVEMRQQGVLRQLRATPVPALHLVGSYIVVDVLLCLAQSTMLVLVAAVVYKVPLTVQGALRALPMC